MSFAHKIFEQTKDVLNYFNWCASVQKQIVCVAIFVYEGFMHKPTVISAFRKCSQKIVEKTKYCKRLEKFVDQRFLSVDTHLIGKYYNLI